MPAPSMPPIEPNRVAYIEPVNGPGKVRFGDFDQQMVVIGHQHVGVQPHSKHAHHLFQQLQEMAPVLVIAENIATLIAARREVIPTSNPLNSQRSGHGAPSYLAKRFSSNV